MRAEPLRPFTAGANKAHGVEPNSTLLVVLLLVLAAMLLWAMIRYRLLLVRIAAGLCVVMLSAVAGMAVVNDYYGYYQTWGQLSADLSGSYSSFATTTASRSGPTVVRGGSLVGLDLPGARSHLNRRGFVYLPPQYTEARYARTRFPVVELLHGTPGVPEQWVVQLNVVRLMNRLLSQHLVGPMILVMPTMSVGHNYQECVNSPSTLDDTYITSDVRTDVLAHYRASSDPAQWGIAGYSSGGYCAANLALRHPAAFGAAGIMDGYFRPQDGPAARALGGNPAAENANNPLRLAGALPAGASPLPAFWISAGTGVAVDIKGAEEFTKALHGIEQVPLYSEPGAGHNFYAWSASVPHLLTWMWTQLASPDQRAQFPIAGNVRNGTLIAPPPPKGFGVPQHRKRAVLARPKAHSRTAHTKAATTHT